MSALYQTLWQEVEPAILRSSSPLLRYTISSSLFHFHKMNALRIHTKVAKTADPQAQSAMSASRRDALWDQQMSLFLKHFEGESESG